MAHVHRPKVWSQSLMKTEQVEPGLPTGPRWFLIVQSSLLSLAET